MAGSCTIDWWLKNWNFQFTWSGPKFQSQNFSVKCYFFFCTWMYEKTKDLAHVLYIYVMDLFLRFWLWVSYSNNVSKILIVYINWKNTRDTFHDFFKCFFKYLFLFLVLVTWAANCGANGPNCRAGAAGWKLLSYPSHSACCTF